LGERGIAFAETFAIIRTRQELRTFDFSTLMKAEFVVKPNHGSKGRGISIVKKLPSSPSQPLLFKIGEHTLTETELKHQLADILDGAYSMTYNDSILIEEKLLP
jgi:glutathione synthase/RimK-type ligase-like ATP-grasp enzyme